MLRNALILSTSVLSLALAPAAHAIDASIFSQAEVGFTKVEGQDFRTAGVRTGALVEILPYLKSGLSVGGISGTQETSLFDTFLGYDVSLELASSMQYGSWQPFFSVRVPVYSDFGASGSIHDFARNAEPGGSDGSFSVKKPDGSLQYYGRSGNRYRSYKMKGSIQGADASIGSGYALTENFSLTVSAGYSARSLKVRTTELDGMHWPDVQWGFAEKHGLTTNDTETGNSIEPNRKSRFFGGTTFSLGMNYAL